MYFIFGALLAIGTLTGFGGFWEIKSFEECRQKAALNAKTEAALTVLIASCREQFPRHSELKAEWAHFAKTIRSHRYVPDAYPKNEYKASNRREGSFASFMAEKYGGKHTSTEGRAELLKSGEFANWFVSPSEYIKVLLVTPMLHENENKIFDAYSRRR